MHPCDNPCWHDTGVMLTSMPPQIEMVCCGCGVKTYCVIQPKASDLVGHGAFHPLRNSAERSK